MYCICNISLKCFSIKIVVHFYTACRICLTEAEGQGSGHLLAEVSTPMLENTRSSTMGRAADKCVDHQLSNNSSSFPSLLRNRHQPRSPFDPQPQQTPKLSDLSRIQPASSPAALTLPTPSTHTCISCVQGPGQTPPTQSPTLKANP